MSNAKVSGQPGHFNYSTKSIQTCIHPDTRTTNEGSGSTSNVEFGVDKATSPPLVTIFKQPAMVVISDSSEADESESVSIQKSSAPLSSGKVQDEIIATRQNTSTQASREVADANFQTSTDSVTRPRSLVTSLLNLSIEGDKLTERTGRPGSNMAVFDCGADSNKVISETHKVIPEPHPRMDRTNCHGDGTDFRAINGTSEEPPPPKAAPKPPAQQFQSDSELSNCSESLSEGEVGRKSSASIGECSTTYSYGYRRFVENRLGGVGARFYRQSVANTYDSNVASYYESPGEWNSHTESSGLVRQ